MRYPTYLYCCKSKPWLSSYISLHLVYTKKQLMGEYEAWKISDDNYLEQTFERFLNKFILNGLVCFECECEEAFRYDFIHQSGDLSNFYIRDQRTEKMKDCLSNDDLFNYGKGKLLYAIHLENVHLTKPFHINELFKDEACTIPLTRAPESYCFAYQELTAEELFQNDVDCGNKARSLATEEDNKYYANKASNKTYERKLIFDLTKFLFIRKVLVFSVQSPWLCKIGNKKKDLEVRKGCPKGTGD